MDVTNPIGQASNGKSFLPMLALLLAAGTVCFGGQFPQAAASPVSASRRLKNPVPPTRGKPDVLRQLSMSLKNISEHSGQAVVQIFAHTYGTGNIGSGGTLLTGQNSSASGVILSPDGYILTNAHVVKGTHSLHVRLSIRNDDATKKNIGANSRRRLTATVVGIDPETDLAVIKVNGSNLPYLRFSDSDLLKQGQLVLALGSPLGLDHSVSLGIVSAVAREIKPEDPMAYIQTDAPINPGNSGGPLVDTDGRVVGINTFILTQSGGSEGIGFAVPSNVARPIYEQLRTQGHVHRAKLGILAETIDPNMADGLELATDSGIVVSDVEPDGPAVSAGIKPDDIVVGIDGKKIASVRQLEANVFRRQPGDTVVLRVYRGSTEMDIPIRTEEDSDDLHQLADTLDPVHNAVPQLGVVGVDITESVHKVLPDLRRPEGVVVVARNTDAPYSGAPLEVGDVIYEINRHVVANVSQLQSALEDVKGDEGIVLLVERDGQLRYLSLEFN